MARARTPTTWATRGNLVQPLLDLAGEQARHERDIVDVLHSLLPTWRERFPAGLCWVWVPPKGIEVYDVFGCHDEIDREHTVAAALHLIERGFTSGVRIHDHAADRKLLTCTCATHEPKARMR